MLPSGSRVFRQVSWSSRPPREESRGSLLTVEISLPDVEELQKLVQDGVEKGFLTYDEIVTGLEEVELTKEQVEDFYTYLIDHSIELVEGVEHKALPHEEPPPEDDKTTAKLDMVHVPFAGAAPAVQIGYERRAADSAEDQAVATE